MIISAEDAEASMADKIAKDVAFRVPHSRVRYTSRQDKELNGKVKVVVLLGFGPPKAVIIPCRLVRRGRRLA